MGPACLAGRRGVLRILIKSIEVRALDSRCGEKDGSGIVLPSLLLLLAGERTFRAH